MPQNPPSVRIPVWFKLGVFASLLAAVATMVMGLSLTSIYERSLTESSLELGAALASDVVQTIELDLEEASVGLENVGRQILDLDNDVDERITRASLVVEGNKVLDHVAIYDAQGQLIDVIKEQKANTPKALDKLDTPAPKGFNVGEAKLDLTPKRVSASLGMPLKDGKESWSFQSNLPLSRIQTRVQTLARERLDADPQGIFIVDGKARILAHPDPSRIGKISSDVPHVEGMSDDLIAQGTSQTGAYTASDGKRYLAVYHPIPQAKWGVVTRIPYEVAFAPLERMKLYVGVVLAAAILASFLMSFLFARILTAPIGRLLKQAQALGERRFDQRIEVSTKDEFSVLGHAMSNAAASLEQSETRIREEQRIRQDLGRFLPTEVVDQVVSDQDALTLGGANAKVTVLFADVVGFTSMCEGIAPEHAVAILNELFTIITEIIFKHQGTVDKFMGDCVMAFWGPPGSTEGHATRALEAAEEILSWLDVGNANWQNQYGISLELAIGVNTGNAILGNIGSSSRMEYTVIGDAVNVAARLEAIARPNQILTTQATVDAADADLFDLHTVGQKTLAGRQDSIVLYEVLL